LEQLFPAELRSKEFRDSVGTKEIHREIDVARLGQYRPDVLALPSPEEVLFSEDMTVAIRKALKKLSFRERTIIEMRFGLGGDKQTYTLEEVGGVFKVTKDRIRQIQDKAICKLRDMKEVSAFFLAAAPDEWTEPPRNLERFDKRHDLSLKRKYAADEARSA
jgi:RNA polymerase sigma factor (sigma-70 family)